MNVFDQRGFAGKLGLVKIVDVADLAINQFRDEKLQVGIALAAAAVLRRRSEHVRNLDSSPLRHRMFAREEDGSDRQAGSGTAMGFNTDG